MMEWIFVGWKSICESKKLALLQIYPFDQVQKTWWTISLSPSIRDHWFSNFHHMDQCPSALYWAYNLKWIYTIYIIMVMVTRPWWDCNLRYLVLRWKCIMVYICMSVSGSLHMFAPSEIESSGFGKGLLSI